MGRSPTAAAAPTTASAVAGLLGRRRRRLVDRVGSGDTGAGAARSASQGWARASAEDRRSAGFTWRSDSRKCTSSESAANAGPNRAASEVGALVKETTEIEHTPRKAAEPEEEEEYPTRAAVRRFLAADVVEQAGLVRQMRSDNESAAAIEREETLLRELRAKLKAAEQAIADAKR